MHHSVQLDYDGTVVGSNGLVGYPATGDLQLAGLLFVDCDVVDGFLGVRRGVGRCIEVREDDEILL